MARASKGERLETKTRMPAAMKKDLEHLAQLHGTSGNDETVEAIAKHIASHDPATCANTWCVTRRAKKNPRS